MIRRNSRVSRILFWGTVFVLCVTLMLISLGTMTASNVGYSLLNTISDHMRTAIQSSTYGENYAAGDLESLFPIFVMYLIFIFNTCNFFLSRWILHNKGIPVIPLGNLSEFQLPQRIIGGIAILIGLGYVMRIADWKGAQVLMDTLLYLAAFIFMFQGLAICAYFMKRQGMPPAWQTMILAALLLLAGPLGLGLAGLTDVVMDLRKQRRTGGNQG